MPIFDPTADPTAPGQPGLDPHAEWLKAITPTAEDAENDKAQRVLGAAHLAEAQGIRAQQLRAAAPPVPKPPTSPGDAHRVKAASGWMRMMNSTPSGFSIK